jgi:predicted nucleotidyltransferase
MLTAEEIVEAAQALAATASSPATVILFGSHARGEAGGHSDVEFLVVEDQVSDQIKEYVRLRKAILGLDAAVDILVVGREHAEARRRVPGSVIRAAFTEGKVVVER